MGKGVELPFDVFCCRGFIIMVHTGGTYWLI